MSQMEELEFATPATIEARSFSIIESELASRDVQELSADELQVLKRVIHTTADFDYAHNLRFSHHAVHNGMEALRKGAHIVTDTTMVAAGINKRVLASFGGAVHTFVANEDVAEEAKRRGVTRSAVAMERAAQLEGPLLFAVGNAPTALVSLHDLLGRGALRAPALVIAVPVGFVNVVESKELILGADVESIVARGRKGGSNVAAAICNALLYLARDNEEVP